MPDTINIGIDLGTTNSVAAHLVGNDAVVVRNNRRGETTPSVVFVAGDRVLVGDQARNQRGSDRGTDVCAEFKQQMGARGPFRTLSDGREVTPVELSAEVLKAVVGHAARVMPERPGAAVITVPAAFELDQLQATVEAAKLAGLDPAPVLPEPIAAMWAYHAQGRLEPGFLLVYDFGGGTFDAAVVKVDDDGFTVVNHEGDNFLGGKIIDWSLVEDVLIPELQQRHRGFDGLRRGDERWNAVLALLKEAAENAKIDLSEYPTAQIEDLELDGDQGPVLFSTTVTREQVARALDEPYTRSANLCRKALADNGLDVSDVAKIVLVGGTTLIPQLRERLADPRDGLGIPLDFSVDPVTIVAQGAAHFAGTVTLDRVRQDPVHDEVSVEIKGDRAGRDLDPLVGGRVHAARERDWSGCTIAFANPEARPAWSSGQVALSAAGTFSTRLSAVADSVSTFRIVVRDPTGAELTVTADSASFTFRHGDIPTEDAPSNHRIGVALADNSVRELIAKGARLPVRAATATVYTAADLDPAVGNELRVPLLSGQRRRADRNTEVAAVVVSARDLPFTLRENEEVIVTVAMDVRQELTGTVEIPELDLKYEFEPEMGRAASTGGASLREDVDRVLKRHGELRERAAKVNLQAAERLLATLDEEGALGRLDGLARAAQSDPVAEQEGRALVLNTEDVLDQVDDLLDLPEFVADLRGVRDEVKRIVGLGRNPEHKRRFDELDARLTPLLDAPDRTVLGHLRDMLIRLGSESLADGGMSERYQFGFLEHHLSTHPSSDVQGLLRRGREADRRGDLDALDDINRRLRPYLPDDVQSDGGPNTGVKEKR